MDEYPLPLIDFFMNYLKLVRTFWGMHSKRKFTGNEAMLYLRLVDLFNGEGENDVWPEMLAFEDGTICHETGISPNTLDKYRTALVERKMIEVKKRGKGYRGGAEYRLINTYSSSKRTSKTSSKIEELPERTSNSEELKEQESQKDTQKVPQKEPQKDTQKLRFSYIYIESKLPNLQTPNFLNKTLFVADRDNSGVWKAIQDQLNRKKKKKPPKLREAPPSPFGDELPALSQAWDLWRRYRKEKGKPDYKPIGLQGAASELMRLSGNDEQRAIAIINQSIAKTWDGFYPLKQNGNYQNHSNRNDGSSEDIAQFGAELDKLFEADYGA
ncbi:hypothetical protein [Spirosoma litoris]